MTEQALRGRVERIDPAMCVDRYQPGPGAVDDREDARLVGFEHQFGLLFESSPLAVGRLALDQEEYG